MVKRFQLPGNFVGRQEIIGIQPLNVIALAERESLIPGCGSSLVLLSDHPNAFRCKLLRNRQSLIG